jgi:hypothetical protein
MMRNSEFHMWNWNFTCEMKFSHVKISLANKITYEILIFSYRTKNLNSHVKANATLATVHTPLI